MVSDIGTATFETAKYLAKLLSPIGQPDYTLTNTTDFIERIKKEAKPERYKILSFNAKILFTNLLLEETLAITLRNVYDGSENNN